MNVKEIKQVLKPSKLCLGINLYRDEPTSLFHCVSVPLGKGKKAINIINKNGGKAWHGLAYTGYSESISVKRK